MTRGGKRGKLKQRVSPSSHRAWKSGRPRRIPTFPQRRRRLLHRHNFQTTPQQFQHFVRDLKETFWGDLYGKTRLAWKEFLEEQSRKERDRSVGVEDYARAGKKRRGYRNGFYVPCVYQFRHPSAPLLSMHSIFSSMCQAALYRENVRDSMRAGERLLVPGFQRGPGAGNHCRRLVHVTLTDTQRPMPHEVHDGHGVQSILTQARGTGVPEAMNHRTVKLQYFPNPSVLGLKGEN